MFDLVSNMYEFSSNLIGSLEDTIEATKENETALVGMTFDEFMEVGTLPLPHSVHLSSMHPCIYSCIHAFIHASMLPSMHPCIHSCIHLSNNSFIHPSMHNSICHHVQGHEFHVYETYVDLVLEQSAPLEWVRLCSKLPLHTVGGWVNEGVVE